VYQSRIQSTIKNFMGFDAKISFFVLKMLQSPQAFSLT